MIAIKATVDLKASFAMLRRIKQIDTRATFKRIQPSAIHDQQQHDRATQGPDGAWPQLAPSTIARRMRPRGKSKTGKNRSWPTKLLGRLPKSLQSIPSKGSLIVRSRVKEFSLAHQGGAIVGHGSRLPRRQFLWISPWLLERARIEFLRAINRIP